MTISAAAKVVSTHANVVTMIAGLRSLKPYRRWRSEMLRRIFYTCVSAFMEGVVTGAAIATIILIVLAFVP